jgi:hypothetical protein
LVELPIGLAGAAVTGSCGDAKMAEQTLARAALINGAR